MKRSSKKKKDEIVETKETSSDEIVETTEISATEAETVELSAAQMEDLAEETVDEVPETVEFKGESKNEIDTEVEEMAEKIAEVEAKDEADLKKDLPKTIEVSAAKTVAAGANSGGMSASTKGFVVLAVIFALVAGLLFWSVKNAAGHGNVELNGLNKAELELLLKDANPMMLKRLAEDPEMKKKQLENLKQLFALANAAKKEGLVKDKVKKELDNVNIELTAVNYDREINKDKGQMPPFGFIGEDRVKAFWGEGQAEATGFQAFLGKIGLGEAAKYQRRQREFDEFLNTKIELAKASGQIKEDLVPSEEDIKQAKEYFAKTRIYYEEAKEKMPTLGEEFKKKTNISIKLQQASYLSRLYAEKVLAEKTKVTDEDINKYIAEHPELDQSAKKTKAEEILNRVKAGEDFAKLAKEFSEDPGSKDKGGLYEGVTMGQFMPEFEKAALALEPGQVSPALVETTYGFHIIKLEKKGEKKGADGKMAPSYDARHILINTGFQDPENPMGGPMPVKEYVTQKLETEKEKAVIDKIIAENPVEIAEDFEIPKVSEEEMQKMMQQQMQMMQQQNPQAETDAPTTTNTQPQTKKPETKKK